MSATELDTIKTQKKLAFTFAKRYGVFISEITANVATISHKPDYNTTIVIELRRYLNRTLQLVALSEEVFEAKLAEAYETGTGAAMEVMLGMEDSLDLDQLVQALPKTEDLLETENDAPIIRLLNALLTQAIKQGASDVHIETFEKQVSVRYRVDGTLREVLTPPRRLAPLIVSRIKVMAKLDIAEKRLPQDGRIALRIAGRAVDVRVSTMPASHGERVVLRLLDKQTAKLDLSHLGIPEDSLATLSSLIKKAHGIILVTGPTGSGKTTSLYACLTQLNESSRNILTVEDPIEYDLPGIGQTNVNTKIDLTFSRGLRAILRQDPDVVMIGEIRDVETANIAIQASLTGHLVFSTLHTNSAIGAITRLRDMGVEPFLISSTMIATVAQRLVRLLCVDCKKKRPITENERQLLSTTGAKLPDELYHEVGCESCNYTGFSGRQGLYEVISIDEQLSDMIHRNSSEAEMEKYARSFSRSLQHDGLLKVLKGETTVEEILRVTNE